MAEQKTRTSACGCLCYCCCCIFLIFAVALAAAGIAAYVLLLKKLQPEEYEFAGWATVSDVPECSSVVRNVFSSGGNIADAAVSALLCMGVAAPHLVGLGGGFLALYYDDESDHIEALNALGISPANVANVDEKSAKRGAKASIVPGALRGYQELHKRLNGTMKWEDLFAPAIKLAKEGFPIKKHFADALAKHQNEISATDIKSIFNSVQKADDKLVQLEMAQLLEELSKKGADFFYTEVAKKIIQGLGPEALLTTDDFKNYKPVWYPPVTKKLGHATLYAPPFPSSGVLLLEAIPERVLNRSQDIKPIMDMTSEDKKLIKSAQDELSSVLAKLPELGGEAVNKGFSELVEEIRSSIKAGKHAAQSTHTVVEDYGGVHLSITKDFKAVTIISGINEPFGSKKASVPGLIMNNYMSAFSSKADAPNKLRGGQQPRTSMVPVFLKDDQQRLLLLQAGSGGGIPGMWALIQPTASGIFTKGPLVSWLAPNDDVHCDGASDGERTTRDKKWEALDSKDHCKRTKACNGKLDLFAKEPEEWIHI
ncbi:glutathione hydrolase 1 proenzyme-like isoform X2 [Dermacentor albipictus]|uniref:glutathione hydrolase 1 proenzyme-like isoform X2 n=1 Tax=Dermacentor albipictus TaxID=60249 RepID=UPI0031FD720C